MKGLRCRDCGANYVKKQSCVCVMVAAGLPKRRFPEWYRTRKKKPTRPRRKGRNPEHYDQKAVFEWAALTTGRFPELELLYAVPNGVKLTKFQGRWMNEEGRKSGVPDMHLPVARGGYHGLYIEQKVPPNQPTESQAWWLEKLAEQGHATEVSYSTEQTIELLTRYLEEEYEPSND